MEINMKACLCAESAGQASGKNLQNAQETSKTQGVPAVIIDLAPKPGI